jgi:hypothetical protein
MRIVTAVRTCTMAASLVTMLMAGLKNKDWSKTTDVFNLAG